MMSTLLKPLHAAFVIACVALVLIAGAGPLATPALAQVAQVPAQGQPDQPRMPHAGDLTTTPAPPPPLSPETRALRSKLDASKLDLDQREAALNRRDLSDAELQAMRQGLDPIAESLRALIDDLAPKLEVAKARLDQLGPAVATDDDRSHDRRLADRPSFRPGSGHTPDPEDGRSAGSAPPEAAPLWVAQPRACPPR